MTTRQFPKRRETDEQQKKRGDRIREKEEERAKEKFPWGWRDTPRISSSGRLTRQ